MVLHARVEVTPKKKEFGSRRLSRKERKRSK